VWWSPGFALTATLLAVIPTSVIANDAAAAIAAGGVVLRASVAAQVGRGDVCFAGGDGGANPFDACLTGEQFGPRWMVKFSKESVREWMQRWFPVGSTHPAWTTSGATTLRVAGHDFSFELGDHAIRLVPASNGPVLVASSPFDLAVWRGAPATLSQGELSTLQSAARRIWDEKLQLLRVPTRDQPLKNVELGTPEVLAVPQSQGLRTVVIPARFVRHGAVDDRGSFFFLMDKDRKITFARFGHPEWNVTANSNVLKISPVFFFRIGGGSTTFLLAAYSGPWEAMGFVILDTARGRIVTSTF